MLTNHILTCRMALRGSSVTHFTEVQPTLENYWRSIILFGRNVASYKFALGKSLLELSQQGNVPFRRQTQDQANQQAAWLRLVNHHRVLGQLSVLLQRVFNLFLGGRVLLPG